MKRVLFICLLVLMVICAFLILKTNDTISNSNNSKVVCQNTIIDLGIINKDSLIGNKIEAKFSIKNISNENIIISHINTSCLCTTADNTESIITPNKWFDIKASYNSDLSPGYFEENLTVNFKNSKSTPILLIFRGKIL